MIRALLFTLALGVGAQAAAQGHVRLGERAGAAVTAKVGTHENALGLAAGASVGVSPWGRAHDVFVRPGIAVEALGEDLGVPGRALGAQVGLEAGYAFGPRRAYRGPEADRSRPRAHTFAYYLLAYLDTDSTSQFAGGIAYRHAGPTTSFDVQFENDALAHQLLDRYRTFALRLRVLRHDRAVPVGVGLRVVAWTGTTEGLGRLGRDETYDLSGQYGGAYAHGILALDLHRGGLTLSVGADAEAIRSTFQNSFHWVINDGQILRIEGRRPRLFLRLALNEAIGLY